MLFTKKAILVILAVVCTVQVAYAYYNLPRLPAPDKYGDVVMDRLSSANGQKAVVFSHWSHRARFSCRICHYELNFQLNAGLTDISENENRDGDFCGACHDGTRAFGHTEEHCAKCHTGANVSRRDKFNALSSVLPKGAYGNRIDWVKAQWQGAINPLYSLV